jgi:hypothetical protein
MPSPLCGEYSVEHSLPRAPTQLKLEFLIFFNRLATATCCRIAKRLYIFMGILGKMRRDAILSIPRTQALTGRFHSPARRGRTLQPAQPGKVLARGQNFVNAWNQWNDNRQDKFTKNQYKIIKVENKGSTHRSQLSNADDDALHVEFTTGYCLKKCQQ